MKSLFVTLLILGGLFALYDYFGAAPWQRLIFPREPRPISAGPSSQKAIEPGVNSAPISSEKPVPPKPVDDWQPKLPQLPNREFVPPVLPTVEAVTKNWTQIPPQAFPRPVVLHQDTEVKMKVGGALLRAGTTAHALSAAAGRLSIAPTASSTARGWVAVTDTDFPDQIRLSYETWKTSRIAQARQAWSAAQQAPTASSASSHSPSANAAGIAFGPDGKPIQNPDGSYNLLLAVISSGRVNDIDPREVSHWSLPRGEMMDGKLTWIIDVTYPTQTIFGAMEVTSHAHIRDRQLQRWVFDSGEPVP
jgi:hypothetical protein